MFTCDADRFPQPDPARLLSREQVEQLLSVSRAQLWRLVRSGDLPVVYLDRRPRFLAEDIENFIRSGRTGGAR